jgi:integrase/recombinase XerD
MKKKVILKRIVHRNEPRFAIIFDNDRELSILVRAIDNSKWSQTNKCWYADDNEMTLKQILATFREVADIDISEIVSDNKKEEPVELSSDDETIEIYSDSSKSITGNNFPGNEKINKPSFIKNRDKNRGGKYDPVRFTINEPDGNLAIRFMGRYDPEWIEEMRLYGKIYYDKIRKDWLLPWSQLKVDSLSDYFSSHGVEVIVIKALLPEVLKELRDEQGAEVRSRVTGKEALEGIERLRNYLEEKRYSKRTIESYLSNLQLFFKYFHDRDPADLDEQDISEFIDDHILKLGYSASYQNLVVSAIKLYYTIAEVRRFDLNSIERPRRSRSLPKVFSKEEVMKIFSVTRNNKHKLMLWLIYSCGLRRSEVTNIRLTDLDRERGILHIREGKGKVDRMVPVSQKIWEKINIYIKSYHPGEYLFEGQTGGRYSVESVYSVFKRSLKRAGIRKDVGVHCLRHSYATHLHESGLDIRYIQELLGHKSTRTTEIYTHVSRRNLFAIRSPIEDMEIE